MKVDVSKITGFDELDAEGKLKAILEYEFDEPKTDSAEITKLKAALSKANSESAEWKRQFREKQTEQERAEAERAENEKALQEELASLRKGKVIDEYMKRCMALGYGPELATECAEAMADGRMNDVFAIQQQFINTRTREIEAAALNKQPGLTPGTPPVQTAEKAEEAKMRSYFGLPPLK